MVKCGSAGPCQDFLHATRDAPVGTCSTSTPLQVTVNSFVWPRCTTPLSKNLNDHYEGTWSSKIYFVTISAMHLQMHRRCKPTGLANYAEYDGVLILFSKQSGVDVVHKSTTTNLRPNLGSLAIVPWEMTNRSK